MKTLTLGTLLTSMWQSPVIALLIVIALVFITDLLNQYIESKKIVCEAPDFSTWSYNDLSTQVRLLGPKPANRKKQTLINSLLQEV